MIYRFRNKSPIRDQQSTTIHRSKITQSTIEVEIKSFDATGAGVARIGTQAVSVPLTIPGERVRIQTRRARDGRMTAALLDVVHPSPHRVAPRCPHFAPRVGPACGGCSWQHIAYAEQLRLKTDRLTRLVREAVPDVPPAQPMMSGTPLDDPWRYRNKVHFVFGAVEDRDGKLAMGHYARGSRRVVNVGVCPVHDDRGNAIAFALREACATTRSGQTLKSVAVRVGCRTPETMATLVVANANEKRLRTATSALSAGDAAPTSMHLNIHPQDDGFIFGRETRLLTGPARLREDVAGVSFLISPTSFFQTNVRAAETLVQLVLAAVPQGATVLDLYAGAGLFALPLARRGHAVIAVEENRSAVEDGVASRDLNGISEARCRFIAAPVERVVGAPGPSSSRRGRPATRLPQLPPVDIVVLDPPRQGCERSVLRAVFAGMKPSAAVYVSCNPESLAVDLRLITQQGYTVRSIQPVDMFPHTPHIEAVVVLGR